MATATLERNRELSPVTAAAWAALEKVASKEGGRDDLAAGARHVVRLTLTGEVDGMPFEQSIAGVLTVGHDQRRAASTTPAQPRLVAAILAKLNQVTRNRVLRELPAEFAASGGMLPVDDDALVTAAEEMLRKLRAEHEVVARGAVRCEYKLISVDEPALQLA
jgi:hypothetical protein